MIAAVVLCAVLLGIAMFFGVREIGYRRPHREIVGKSGLDSDLVYAVIKAESSFNEKAKSNVGAVGLMQLLPSTAEFVCQMNGIDFQSEQLTDGAYNVRLGCLYLKYLLDRFGAVETALAAYNAGEGTVARWLKNSELSSNGSTLEQVPYPETARYVKKVIKFRKIYRFFYH